MIKRISSLCLLFSLIIGVSPSVFAQYTNTDQSKELLIAKDNLVNAMSKIMNSIQEMDQKVQEGYEKSELNYLSDFYLNNPQQNSYAIAQKNPDSRFDRIETMLNSMMIFMGQQSNSSSKIFIDRNNQNPQTVVVQSSQQNNTAIEGLQKQIELMQGQIEILVKAISDTTTNSNLNNIKNQIYLLKANLEKQKTVSQNKE